MSQTPYESILSLSSADSLPNQGCPGLPPSTTLCSAANPFTPMDPQMAYYNYQPLLPHEDARMITLLPPRSSYTSEDYPGNPDGIQCEIHHVVLAKNPQYKALSYCWGDPTQITRYIICDGRRLNVTVNL